MRRRRNPSKAFRNHLIRSREKALFRRFPNEAPIRARAMGRVAGSIWAYYWD